MTPKTEEGAWDARLAYWRKRLGRLRLGDEPIAVELARDRRVAWALTLIAGAIGAVILTLFTVFGRVDIGLLATGVLIVPIIVGAWVDHALVARRAHQFSREQALHSHPRFDEDETRTSS